MTLRGLVIFLSWGIAIFALVAYGFFPFGAMVHPLLLAAFEQQRLVVYAHVFAAPVALLAGPLQLWPAIRNTYPTFHRGLGRIYLTFGVALGGISGLLMARHATGGPVAQTGFALLAIAWLATGAIAYWHIRNGNLAQHRRWMIRNFALSFAAVTLRIYIPVSVAAGADFEAAYRIIAWVCWVPNLIAVEGWLARQPRRKAMA